jgi:hypothetical protein
MFLKSLISMVGAHGLEPWTRLKSQLLYQLSYTPIEAALLPAPRRG